MKNWTYFSNGPGIMSHEMMFRNHFAIKLFEKLMMFNNEMLQTYSHAISNDWRKYDVHNLQQKQQESPVCISFLYNISKYQGHIPDQAKCLNCIKPNAVSSLLKVDPGWSFFLLNKAIIV